MDSLFRKPVHFYSPILSFLITTLLFASDGGKVLVQEVEGEVKIIPALITTIPGPAVAGKTLSSGDVIKTSPTGSTELFIPHQKMTVKMHPGSELMYMDDKGTCLIIVSQGLLFFTQNDSQMKGCRIQTDRSKIDMTQGELLLTSDIVDEIYSLMGEFSVVSTREGNNADVVMGEMVMISLGEAAVVRKFEANDIPEEYYNKFTQNQALENIPPVFTLLTPLSTGNKVQEENTGSPKKYFLNVNGGLTMVGDFQYSHVALNPVFSGETIYFGYNLAGFMGVSDSVENLNRFSSLSRILAPLDFRITTPRIEFHVGRIENLTFGHGSLLKNYTNTVSYPLLQDGGVEVHYTSYTERISAQFFISGVEELTHGGGILGIYSSGLINPLIPLRIGFGLVSDLNQLGSLPDTSWGERTAPTSSLTGIQAGFTYHLDGDLRRDTYVFGEFSIHNYHRSLRYIKSVAASGDTTEQGFERTLSYGITGPGMWWKLGHFSEAKIAFVFASALHQFPYFNESYSLERAHYVPASEVAAIEKAEPYGEDEKWTSMIKSHYAGIDSSSYYLPKDVNYLLDPTFNSYDKIGLLAAYQHNFRTYYEFGLDFMYLTETGNTGASNSYMSLEIDTGIHEGLIHGISEFGFYYKHQFTPALFSTSKAENIIYGFNLGIKILKNLNCVIQSRTVFFDKNFDGKTDKITTQGINLNLTF